LLARSERACLEFYYLEIFPIPYFHNLGGEKNRNQSQSFFVFFPSFHITHNTILQSAFYTPRETLTK